ncbi:MAG: hypothetical protein EXS49_01180 [Candidatus Pacebacteria bacterium]|nr:hypothetical protein [Candidatus Paceibacterota bacterium]
MSKNISVPYTKSNNLISGEKERHKYTGHELDEETGYTYAKARYLNTDTGRFASIDPMFWKLNKQLLVDPQQQNSYSYARNNPLIYVDRVGEIVELVSRPINEGIYGYIGAHAYISISAENPKMVGNISYIDAFNNIQQVDTSKEFTLGAYANKNNNLYKAANGDPLREDCSGCSRITVAPPKGMSQEAFETNLVDYYNSSPNILNEKYGPLGIGWGNGANSNNAATSFLIGAGVSRFKIDNYYQNILGLENRKWTPGLGEPLGSPTLYTQYRDAIILLNNTISNLKNEIGSLISKNNDY